jgi:mono/diheme cytochrome c family protein
LAENDDAVRALTAAVFASEAPRWTDYFAASTIDVEQAQRGSELFEATCSGCHGSYDKGWQADDASSRSEVELLETVAVRYHARTPLFDVGTDGQRGEGMTHFADRLNALEISQRIETVVEPQSGYVPPPLNGIWARYPYLHNNAVPSLCALLTVGDARPTEFVQGPSESIEDFDVDCVGYPIGEAIPQSWGDDEDSVYRVGGPGMSNAGHDEWLTGVDGAPTFSDEDRDAVIAFLKTL